VSLKYHDLSIICPILLGLQWERDAKRILLTSDFKSFKEMLENPELYKAFRKHVGKYLALENCVFYEEVILRLLSL
jgi:hypothetical protein